MNRRLVNAALVVVLLAPLLAYVSSIRYQFVFDDPDQIVNNAAVHSWSSVPHFFTSDVWPHATPDEVGNFYRPVFLLWLLVNYKIGGLSLAWWHLVSIGLHLLATLLVFLLVRRVTRDDLLAGGSALLFGLHPAHIEAVTWISGVTEPLLAVFFLSSFLCYLKSREQRGEQNQRRALWFAASLSFFVLAILEKETAVIFPALVFCYEWIFGSVSEKEKHEEPGKRPNPLTRALISVSPFIALTVLYLVIRVLALKGLGHAITPLSLKTLVLTWPSILFFYARSLVWPVGLSAFYDTPYITSITFAGFIVPALSIAIIALLLYVWSRRSRLVSFFSLWLILPLLPLMNISAFKEGEIAHDRYLYLPSIGFCVLVVFAIRQLHLSPGRVYGQPALQIVLVVILAGFFGIATAYEKSIWASDLSLSTQGVAVAPNNVIAANNMGKELALRGDYGPAITLFRRVVDRRPGYWLGNFNLGYVYYRVGNFPEAERYLRKAIEIKPDDAAEQRFLGFTLAELGHNDEAEAALQRAIALRPNAANQHYVLGMLLKQKGDAAGALPEFRLELSLNPNHAEARQQVNQLEAHQGVKP
ncbi:MAG: protein O-mannosyl-transferase [Blastocatellia bacterium]|jgi:tetratricopeptide (TPR) repeat protein|nr:protein O-mannosyl-transferase [Blastocatellia bacterium]